MSANCPRCQQPLEVSQVDTIEVRLCRGCRGVLLAHPDLVRIIESSWHAVTEKQAEEMAFRAPDGWQEEAAMSCPDCGQSMEKYGYMGLAAIQIDRCDACALVWLDTDELQNMVLALAKSNYRSQRAMQEASKNALDYVTPAMTAAAFPVRSHNWLFNRNATDAVVMAFNLLQLFVR